MAPPIKFLNFPLELRLLVWDCIGDDMLQTTRCVDGIPNMDQDSAMPLSSVVQDFQSWLSVLRANHSLRHEFTARLFNKHFTKEWLLSHLFIFNNCRDLGDWFSIVPRSSWPYIQGMLTVEDVAIHSDGPGVSLKVESDSQVHLVCSQQTRHHSCPHSESLDRPRTQSCRGLLEVEDVRRAVLDCDREECPDADIPKGSFYLLHLDGHDSRNHVLTLKGLFNRRKFFRKLLIYGLWQKGVYGRTFNELYADKTVSIRAT